ncbi:MAG: flagellar assembly protein FliH [Cellvibrio sp.]|nr:flagellar assembly protein FliH [Cellvibrio sp.]
MTDKNLHRIAGESIESMQPWILPPVNDNGRVLSTVEKDAKERKERLLRKSKESIQTIEMPPPTSPLKGMTAQELEKIFSDAEQDGFAKGHAEGVERGRAEGYEAGKQQGLKEMRDQLTAEQLRFKHLANSLLQPLNDQDSDIEQLVLEMVCSLTQNVIQREMQLDSSMILDVVKTAVDALPIGSKNIRIFLHPKDISAVETYASEHQLEWKFLTDPELIPGGCKVETLESRIDFSVSHRLQSVLEEFLKGQLAQAEHIADSTDPDDHSHA